MIDEALGLVHRYLTSASSAKRNPEDQTIRRVGLVYVQSGSGGSSRSQFEGAQFDLEEITAAYDTDSYVRQAVDKYTDLIFKAGWNVVGVNENAIEYVKMRLELIAEATQTPTEEFFNQIAEDLVKYGNAFIVKSRLGSGYSFPNGIQVQPVGKKKPVVGYFVLPSETIQIARDKNGTIKGYQQDLGDKPVTFRPEDIIHVTWKKKRGQAFGSSFLIPVLPDVRLLREIEDNVNRLLHKYLHPLYKFKVGTTDEGFQSTPEEVDLVREMIEDMPTDGTLVLPERYDVDVIGAQGEAINAEWALRYFEQRVFTGFGVPETVFGRGANTNRSTADNLTSEMHDRVKAFQRVIATAIDEHIIKEILMEGGFDPIMNPDEDVDFKFEEIAIDEQVKLENQALYLYEHNGITFGEMRKRLGYEVEVADESQMYLNRVQIVLKGAESSDEEEPGTADNNNKMKPTNQHGTKTSPKKTTSDNEKSKVLEMNMAKAIRAENALECAGKRYENLRNDVLQLAKNCNEENNLEKQIPMVFSQTKDAMLKDFKYFIQSSLNNGVGDCKNDMKVSRSPNVNESLAARIVERLTEEKINTLFDVLMSGVSKKIKEENSSKSISSLFDVANYRVGFIIRTKLMKSYNYGYALAAQSLGQNFVKATINEEACKICIENKDKKIELAGDFYKDLPPWHANCLCRVEIAEENGGRAFK